jgi:xylulokinase
MTTDPQAGAPVTVGIDIGTSSVKAIAATEDGTVVARARVAHPFRVPSPSRFEHDVEVAWRHGPRAALAAIEAEVPRDRIRGVSVAAMVPSLAAVDADGHPLTVGLLYGDERGRAPAQATGSPAETGELRNFARWLLDEAPGAAGLWPAQAVANHALCGTAALDTSTAATAAPLFDFTGWDAALVEEIGARVEQFPRLVPTGWECGRIDGDGPALASGCIDAFAEQLVAGADHDGDVLVILGTTLIVWAVSPEPAEVPGYWTIPHSAPGRFLVGGPSNAGGLFCDWARRLVADGDRDGRGDGGGDARPGGVPVWAPYPRGERVPLHDPGRRAVLADLDLTHDAAAVRRAAYEASGFVTRRILDAARAHAGIRPRRIVATGGGIRVREWCQALADATELPVECVAVPEGGALGSAWLARIAAGLEAPTAMTEGRRWARTGTTVEPDPAWLAPVADRYARFLELSA